MIINTNLSAQTGSRLLMESTTGLNKSLARLSSGLRIVSPEDDAAGLAVSSRFDAQINRINAVSNAISFSQTQDGYLKKIAKALDRMSELSVLARDVTKSPADIALYQTEFTAQAAFINDLSTKQFNSIGLLDATDRDVTVDSEGSVFTMTGIDETAYDLSGEDLTADAARRFHADPEFLHRQEPARAQRPHHGPAHRAGGGAGIGRVEATDNVSRVGRCLHRWLRRCVRSRVARSPGSAAGRQSAR